MLMTVTCPTCRATYKLDPARIPAAGGLITCKNCQAKITVRPPPPPEAPEEIEQLSEADEVVEKEEPTLKTMKVRRDALDLPPAPGPPPSSFAPAPAARAAAPSAPAEAMPVAPGASLYECPHCHKPFYLKEARKSGATPAESSLRAAPPPADGRKTVLVVDDQEFFRTFARDLLSPRYRILEADSTALALELIPGADLVVLDLNLTGEDGRTVLRGKPPETRCLIFSGQEEMADDPALFRELQGLGADDLLMKSIAAGDELKRKVATLLGDAPAEGRPRLD